MTRIITLIIFIYTTANVKAQCLNNRTEFESYFKANIETLNPIEGIWSESFKGKLYEDGELIDVQNQSHSSEVAIIRDGDSFRICSLNNGAKVTSSSVFNPTANPNMYIYKWTMYKQVEYTTTAIATMKDIGIIEFKYEISQHDLKILKNDYNDGLREFHEKIYIKTFPNLKTVTSKQKSSGTGIAISSNGIIATNFHVVDQSKIIKIRGINSNFNKAYTAKIIFTDQNNDLALLKIEDNLFTSLGNIPYTIKTKLSDVGENIFVLGYPLRATMGDEIKLTNGIISSRTGFQSDITTYQISAPVQPGNSGGPVFDSQGNLIGIINAKHLGAENASYAVKATYLSNLIDLIPSPPKQSTVNLLSGKTLSQQVELAKKVVFIIETE